jgi:hypothetical protein
MVEPHMRWALLFALAGCGDNSAPSQPNLVAVTGASPYGSCDAGPGGTVYPGMEVEPSLAVDGDHLVVTWQQDRWSDGGANAIGTAASFDGGKHWTAGAPAFSICAGGAYERASDPWVSIAGDVTYESAIAFDTSHAQSVVLAASSPDGGATWSDPAVLIVDGTSDVLNDKDSLTASGNRAYVVWDRVTGLDMPNKPIGTGPTMLARATAGVWEPARAIYDPGVDNQTIGNIIVALPDGTLVDVFDLIMMMHLDTPPTSIAVIRSTDNGDTWSAPIVIADAAANAIGKMQDGSLYVRSGAPLPAIAVDASSGAIYIAWEDGRFGNEGIALVASHDGGITWSAPVQVNGDASAQAFTPGVAVADDGTVGVFYYDTRDDVASEKAFRATAWLATSHDGGATWTDTQASRPVDLTSSLVANQYWFLGDYLGLASRGSSFAAAFGLTVSPTDPTDIFVYGADR